MLGLTGGGSGASASKCCMLGGLVRVGSAAKVVRLIFDDHDATYCGLVIDGTPVDLLYQLE